MSHMLRLSNTFKDFPVLSLRNGSPVATVQGQIINPNNLKIEGWYCKDHFSNRTLILLTEDIRETAPQGFIVDDHDVLAEPEDLVRLSSIIRIKFVLNGKKVITTNGSNVGKVGDYAIDIDSMLIQKLYINQSLVKSINGGAVIDRQQIVEINDKAITVRDTEVPVESPFKQLLKVRNKVTPAYPSASSSFTKE